MNTSIPAVTDTQFAFGFRSAVDLPALAPPPACSQAQWCDVARHIIAFGLGERPDLQPRPGVDLSRALRLLGALLNTPDGKVSPEQIGRLLATWFVRLQPQGGPLAVAP